MDPLDILLELARIQVQGTVEERANLLLADREQCSKRGYHRVEQEPKNPNPDNPTDIRNLLICSDCDVYFGKYDDFAYRVE